MAYSPDYSTGNSNKPRNEFAVLNKEQLQYCIKESERQFKKKEEKMNVNKITLLASGYTFMYPIVITKGKIRYYFLGLIGENLATTIMCKDADDYHYRVDTLNESEFYKIANYTDDLELLTKAAKVRVNKEEFLLGVEIPVKL